MTAARAPPPLRGGLRRPRQPSGRRAAQQPGPPFRLRPEDLRRPLSREVQHRPQPAEAAARNPPSPVTPYGTQICAPGNVANRRPPTICFSLRRSGYGRPVNHLCPFSETPRTKASLCQGAPSQSQSRSRSVGPPPMLLPVAAAAPGTTPCRLRCGRTGCLRGAGGFAGQPRRGRGRGVIGSAGRYRPSALPRVC